MSLLAPDIRLPKPSAGTKRMPHLSLDTHMKDYRNAYVFSPHFDDAVLSMGSLMTSLLTHGLSVTVVTFFTKGSSLNSPLTRKLLTQARSLSAASYFAKRKAEDQKALAAIGTLKIKNFSLVDAAWRSKEQLALYPETTLAIEHAHDRETRKAVQEAIQTLSLEKKQTLIFAPLGLGKHIDHVIVRDAATVFAQTIFYADFPYSHRYDLTDDFVTKNHLTMVQWEQGDYTKKRAALFAYQSQYASFFEKGDLPLVYETFALSRRIASELQK